MKKSATTINMMMEMCMRCMCLDFCVPFSDMFSISEVDHCAA